MSTTGEPPAVDAGLQLQQALVSQAAGSLLCTAPLPPQLMVPDSVAWRPARC